MSNKYELAQYLVNLHTLLEAQAATGGLNKSTTIVDEYNKNWDMLKDTITKENERDTRTR